MTSSQSIHSHLSPTKINSVTVIGGGVIGASWTALFLAKGLSVCVNDTNPKAESMVRSVVEAALPDLEKLGCETAGAVDRLTFDADLKRAVRDADAIQENGPENVAFKQKLWADVEAATGDGTLLLSSSSSIPPSIQGQAMRVPLRVVIGHPFSPPHVLPLVEIVAASGADEALVTRAISFYRYLGKRPVRLNKEIPGFVGNRLQAALFQEAVFLVREGVVSIDQLDEIVTQSIGARWAAAGPFRSFHLGGGPGGLEHFIDTLGKSMAVMWKAMGKADFDDTTRGLLLHQAESAFSSQAYEKLAAHRDELEIEILKAQAAAR